jgi:RHS repeat-associated protein
MSDPDGDPADAAVYTAFGERICGTNHRYGYDGAYGYQAHDFPSADPIPYLHVGARYYDPGSGRFLQRDPIGIYGGLNVYEYCASNGVYRADPTGLKWSWGRAIIGGIAGAITGAATGGGVGAVTGAIAGAIVAGTSRSAEEAVAVGALAGIGGGVGALVGSGAVGIAAGTAIVGGVGAAIGAVKSDGDPVHTIAGGWIGAGGVLTGVVIGARFPDPYSEPVVSCISAGSIAMTRQAVDAGISFWEEW